MDLMAYTAAQRTHEIGIRMALGAESRCDDSGLREGLVLAVFGVAVGLAAALALDAAFHVTLWSKCH
jgi:ABC-type antimicrobial peptide transport system permease subunit